MEASRRITDIIDYIIFGFFIIFLVSLTDSIFLNQVGYYGALLFLIFKYILSKENPFEKTGLELAFFWLILVEILSAVTSDYSGEAFTNLLRRIIILPVVYTTIAVGTQLKRGIAFFWFYIGASMVTVLIYLYFSYQHYISNLYGATQSGPSVFQYPITASEIISFTVVFLFAFLINEKTNLRNKILLFAGFGLSALALMSTYKRTGWLGAAFGILVILIVKKEWRILVPAAAIGIILFAVQTNISEVYVFNYNQSKLENTFKFDTDGRASDVFPVGDKFLVSDYENGLLIYEGNKLLSKKDFPAPVVSVKKWRSSYYVANLIDTRFVPFQLKNNVIETGNELLSAGYTTDYKIYNNLLYVLDKDSGLTVFTSPVNSNSKLKFPGFSGYEKLFISPGIFLAASLKGELKVFDMRNLLPGDALYKLKINPGQNILYYSGNSGLMEDGDTLKLFSLSGSGLHILDETTEINSAVDYEKMGERFLVSTLSNEIFELSFPFNGKIKILSRNNLGFTPASFSFNGEKLYATRVKRSRLLSIFDFNLPSNFTRLALWRAGWEIFLDHPVLGVGDIDLQKYYVKYKRDYDKEIQGHMHNNFVHMLVILGIMGFFAFCYLLLKMILIDFKIYRVSVGVKFISSYSLGAIGCFFAFLIAGLTEMNIWDQEILTLVLFIFGLNVALYISSGLSKAEIF